MHHWVMVGLPASSSHTCGPFCPPEITVASSGTASAFYFARTSLIEGYWWTSTSKCNEMYWMPWYALAWAWDFHLWKILHNLQSSCDWQCSNLEPFTPSSWRHTNFGCIYKLLAKWYIWFICSINSLNWVHFNVTASKLVVDVDGSFECKWKSLELYKSL